MMYNFEETLLMIKSLNEAVLAGTAFDLFPLEEIENANLDFINYIQSMKIEVDKSIVMSITPDGENTIIGRLMNDDGKIFAFDIDFDNEKYSSIKEVQGTDVKIRDEFASGLLIEEKVAKFLLGLS